MCQSEDLMPAEILFWLVLLACCFPEVCVEIQVIFLASPASQFYIWSDTLEDLSASKKDAGTVALIFTTPRRHQLGIYSEERPSHV